jgi:predicted nucleotidyltransferase
MDIGALKPSGRSVEGVVVFGFYGPQPSPARQNLDLLVEWEPGRDLLDHARLVQYLEALHF